MFDDFVRSQEQFNDQKVKNLEHELAGLKSYSAGLETSLKDASTHSAHLEKLLMVMRSEAAKSNAAMQLPVSNPAQQQTTAGTTSEPVDNPWPARR